MSELARNPVVEAIKRLVTPGMVALDIGANRGLTAQAMVECGATVYAFEPIESCAAEIAARALPGVTIVRSAVSDVEGTANLNLDLREGLGMEASSLCELPVHGPTIAVPVTTVDAFVNRNGLTPNFIKIDVEGVEERVITGGMQTIRRHRPIMIFEVWGYNWPRFEAVIAELSSLYRFECASDGADALARYAAGVITESDDLICIPA